VQTKYITALVLIVLAGGIVFYLLGGQSITSNGQTISQPDQGKGFKTPKLMDSIAITQKPISNELDISTVIKDPILKTIPEARIMAFVSTTGSLNYNNVNIALESANFSEFMGDLYDPEDEISIVKQQQFSEMLNEVDELSRYTYDYACGKGVCGLLVSYIDSGDAKSLSTAVINNVALGAVVEHVYVDENEQKEMRLIFNQDNSQNGRTMTFIQN
jgi:hypothetical protein